MAVSALLLGGAGFIHDGINFGGGHPGLPLGLFRVAFGFFFGVVLYRAYHAQRLPKWTGSAVGAFLALTCLLAVPVGGGWKGDFYDLFCLLVGFPALVIYCLHISTSNAFLKLSGDISYPLYAIHFPFLFLCTRYFGTYPSMPTAWLWLNVLGA